MLNYVHHSVFGWKAVHVSGVAGEVFPVVATEDTIPGQRNHLTFWVKGHTQAGDHNRRAGELSTTHPTLPKGDYSFVLQEDSAWWCFPAGLNGGLVPAATALRVAAGDKYTALRGARILVAHGALDGLAAGTCIHIAKADSREFTADSETYLLIF